MTIMKTDIFLNPQMTSCSADILNIYA